MYRARVGVRLISPLEGFFSLRAASKKRTASLSRRRRRRRRQEIASFSSSFLPFFLCSCMVSSVGKYRVSQPRHSASKSVSRYVLPGRATACLASPFKYVNVVIRNCRANSRTASARFSLRRGRRYSDIYLARVISISRSGNIAG